MSSTIQLISSSPVIEQTYIAVRLWDSLQVSNDCEDKQPLLQVAVWAIGEYGDLFMYGTSNEGMNKFLKFFIYQRIFLYCVFELENFELFIFVDYEKPTENELIKMYHRILTSTQVSITSKQYALVSLAKLSTRLEAGIE